jgi:hypothetical protein
MRDPDLLKNFTDAKKTFARLPVGIYCIPLFFLSDRDRVRIVEDRRGRLRLRDVRGDPEGAGQGGGSLRHGKFC